MSTSTKRYRLSFQLYSSRNFGPVDGQLATLASLGFDGVETYPGAYGDDPQGFRERLDALGLACFSAHLPYDRLDDDRDALIAEALVLGAETVVAPNLSAAKRPADVAGWAAVGARLGQHADVLGQHDLRLAWHNHDFEYVRLADGSRPIDGLLSSPNVLFEPDIGMMAKAKADPATEIEKFAAQVTAFHVKDFKPASSGEIVWTDIGSGEQDWPRIWKAIAGCDGDLLVCEHDDPLDFASFATRSGTYLRAMSDPV